MWDRSKRVTRTLLVTASSAWHRRPEFNLQSIPIDRDRSLMSFQLSATRATGRPQRLVVALSGRQSITPFAASQPSPAGGPGDKLLPLLRTPFDLLALPGRVALGTLQSLPEVLEKM